MIAHATHSYYGSTQLLEVDRQPFWVVNEGEYCMMNTLDLAVDHVFWELEHNPWLVRNLLDTFVSSLQLHGRGQGLQGRSQPWLHTPLRSIPPRRRPRPTRHS